MSRVGLVGDVQCGCALYCACNMLESGGRKCGCGAVLCVVGRWCVCVKGVIVCTVLCVPATR